MNIHHHLVIRANIASPPTEIDTIGVDIWMGNLIRAIGMNILDGPRTIYCNKTGNRGMTSSAIIDTSHIALHTWDEELPGMLQLDVYSCAAFDIFKIISHLDIFNPTHIDYKFLDRTGDFILVN